MQCCQLNVGYNFNKCLMKDTNTWPDPSTYVTLTVLKAAAMIREIGRDNETDLYVPPPIDAPFTVNQLYVNLFTTGPLITEFPIPIQALMDIGSPCTVISSELCNCLSLHWYPLPIKENNLTSLSQLPLICEGYVKLELQSASVLRSSLVQFFDPQEGQPWTATGPN